MRKICIKNEVSLLMEYEYDCYCPNVCLNNIKGQLCGSIPLADMNV